jgi:hypothetical protein
VADTAEQLDVAAILGALRQEVREARAAQGEGEAGTALSAIERELHHSAEQLEITRVVSHHWPLNGRGLYERGLIVIHKLVRRYLRWYIGPIVEQQNAFNDAATRSIRLLIEAQAELREQMAELRRAQEAARAVTPEAGGPGGQATGRAGDQETGERGDAAPSGEQLQQQVERAGRAEAPAPLPDLGLRQLPAQLVDKAAVSAHWDLGGDTPLTRARALAQRGVRQYLRWMINPIVEQQNAFNTALAETAPPLLAADAELRARAAGLRADQRKDAR